MPHLRRPCAGALLALFTALGTGAATYVLAQGPREAFPAATTIAALTTYPGFYHQRQVVVRGEARVDDRGHARLAPRGGAERGNWLRVAAGRVERA